MGGLWTLFSRTAPGFRLAWAGVAVAVFLAACTSASPAAAPTAPQMFDSQGNPVDEPPESAASSSSTDDVAPDFELSLFQNANHARGEAWRLSDFEGKPVVLNFWFPSCPPCVAEMPDLEKTFQKYSPMGVEFVGVQLVGLDTVSDGQAFVDELGVNYALGPDETGSNEIVFKKYGVKGFPTTVFIDENHQIVRKWTGILTEDKIDELVGELLN
ncbi:MAG: TlpA family protein disulfide reductase [Chloroflexi bacterium]|nr:TlpA family protein disulfide reductase [Chloroflexota bacterium]